ncbi:VWA domain-containing protein, partial [Streptosporangium algeriense]
MQQPQRRRRNVAPFVIAILVAGSLIVGLRLFIGGPDDAGGGGGEPGKETRTAAACDGQGVRLTVAASLEKAELLRRMAAGYSGREVGGRCAEIAVTRSSGGLIQALARGWDEERDGPRPDVWSPASSSWIALLRQQ